MSNNQETNDQTDDSKELEQLRKACVALDNQIMLLQITRDKFLGDTGAQQYFNEKIAKRKEELLLKEIEYSKKFSGERGVVWTTLDSTDDFLKKDDGA